MSEHKRVVAETIKHLYARIQNPTASDQERRRIALKAVEQIEPEGTGEADEADEGEFSLDGLTINQVKGAVAEGRISAEDALRQEMLGAQRSTLVAWLEEEQRA